MIGKSDEERATQMARSFTPIDFGGTVKARAESILAFVTAVRAEASAAKATEIAALLEALKPFAELARGIPDAAHDAAPACRIGQDAKFPGTFTTISNGLFRAARAALEMSGGVK